MLADVGPSALLTTGEPTAAAPAGAPSRPDPLDVALGVAAVAVAAGGAAGRGAHAVLAPVARGVLRAVPLTPRPRSARWLTALAGRGAERRVVLRRDLSHLLDVLVGAVTREVLRRGRLADLPQYVDLDRIVAAVDLDRAVARMDADAVARRRDLGAIVDRLDLVRLTEEVIDAIDLPAIIRESTGSMASETLHDVRMQGIAADEAVGRAVDRLLLRRTRRLVPRHP
jgi:hypothetical protein